MFDEAGGTAAAAFAVSPSEFAAGQQAVPVVLLSRAVIDETVD
jgi:hypothetical protein